MEPKTQSSRQYPPKPRDVHLFATCLVDQFMPEAGLDTVRLLEREGIRVHYLEQQTCCGQPAHSSGFPDEARKVALQQLNLFTQPWPVVVPSGSCGGTARSVTDSTIWGVWSQVYGRMGLYRLASWFMRRGRALSPTEQGAWTRSRTPLIPAPRRLRDLLKDRKP